MLSEAEGNVVFSSCVCMCVEPCVTVLFRAMDCEMFSKPCFIDVCVLDLDLGVARVLSKPNVLCL